MYNRLTSVCLLYVDKDETINHIVSEYSKLAQKSIKDLALPNEG